jgi:ComF family protein
MIATLKYFPRWLGRQSLELLCPSSCALCRVSIDEYDETLCPRCWQQFQTTLAPPACPTCGHNVGTYELIDDRCHRCQNRRPVVSRLGRVGQYDGLLRDFTHALKYHNQTHLDRFLGKLIAATILGDKILSQAEILIPIPLHWRRRWKRHYNQSDLLARQIRYHLKKQGHNILIRRDLVRIRHTVEQSSLAISDRIQNVRGAFAVRDDADFTGKHICLIDDITTTGATLRAAANALKKTNLAKITAAVLAVAGNYEPRPAITKSSKISPDSSNDQPGNFKNGVGA